MMALIASIPLHKRASSQLLHHLQIEKELKKSKNKMRFIALSCLSSAVLAILDMNQLMALKNQASDSTMQSPNRLVFSNKL